MARNRFFTKLRTNLSKALASALVSAMALGLGVTAPETISAAETSAADAYVSLDRSEDEQISFDGSTVEWNGKSWELDETTIFIDFRLTDDQIKNANGRAFRSLSEAKFGLVLEDGSEIPGGAIVNGTSEKRMTILAAPGVYWVDAPPEKDAAVRPARPEGDPELADTPSDGNPFGMTVKSDYLYIYGLNTNRANVVFASARGQQKGSNGNFTMFRMQGSGENNAQIGGTRTENVTFGNYANVDLVYPLDEEVKALGGDYAEGFSRKAIPGPIVQAQLFNGGGGSLSVNTAFISRLNLQPIGAALYVDCYIESSGHSGGGSTYVNSDIRLYNVNFSGGNRFFNSRIYLDPLPWNLNAAERNPGGVYEAGLADNTTGNGIMVDTEIIRGDVLIDADVEAGYSWADKDPKSVASRSYQYNVTLDGEPYVVQDHLTPGVTVGMEGDLLSAFRLSDEEGNVYYNLKNLGTVQLEEAMYEELSERFANLNMEKFAELEAAAGVEPGYYSTVPRNASFSRVNEGEEVLTGPIRLGAAGAENPWDARESAEITLAVEADKDETLTGEWVFEAYEVNNDAENPNVYTFSNKADYVTVTADGNTLTVGSTLTKDISYETKDVVIVGKSELGIEAAFGLKVEPQFVEAPVYTEAPEAIAFLDGAAKVDYTIANDDPEIRETTNISWYRAESADAEEWFQLAYSRFDPLDEYALTEGDIGYFLKAEITPKLNLSEANEEAKTVIISDRAVTSDDVSKRFWDDDWNDDEVPGQGREVAWFDFDFSNFRGSSLKSDINMSGQPETIPGTMSLVNGWRVFDGVTTGGGGADGHPGIEPSSGGDDNKPSRMFYVPMDGAYGDMKMQVTVAPNKNEGQGFGSAPSFMDFYIKADAINDPDAPAEGNTVNDNRMLFTPGIKNGYALRVQRLSDADVLKVLEPGWDVGGAGVGVAVYLMKYEDGVASFADKSTKPSDIGTSLPQTITVTGTDAAAEGVPAVGDTFTKGAMIGSFLTEFTVEISLVRDGEDADTGTLTAVVYSDAEVRGGDDFGYPKSVELTATVDWNEFGGFGTSYASSTNVNASTNINSAVITSWRAEMEKVQE